MASRQKPSGTFPELVERARAALQENDLGKAVALFEDALLLNPSDANCLNALGSVHFSLQQYEESEQRLRAALNAAPSFANASGNLGLVCQHLGKHEEALQRLQYAVQNRSATPQIALALGKELVHQLRPDRARALLTQVIKANPDFTDALVLLGMAEGDCGQAAAAESHWKKAETLAPNSAGPNVGRARLKQSLGDIDGAIPEIEAALMLDSYHAYALFSWANIADGNAQAKLSRADVLEMIRSAQEKKDISHDEAAWLSFAAGRLLDKDKNHGLAAENYIRANDLVWKTAPVSQDMYQSWHDRLLATFDDAFFSRNREILEREPKGQDKCGEGLVFIVGMPRSGTTLVEQILSRSDTVFAGGELPHMDTLANAFLGQLNKGQVDLSKVPLDMALVRQLAGGHHENIQRLSGRCEIFTDKSPRNFMNLGVIACLFPRSRIVHCVRNPVDTCLSCYFNHFGFNAVKYSYNQEMLGFFYGLYRQMMDHWRRVLPVTVFDAVYEGIVGSPNDSIHKLTDFCDFEWDERFLHPEDSKRAANTASVAQVKKPIYGDSVDRWKPYEPYIGPLLDAIGEKHLTS